jgi:hypothetical protein
LNVIAALLPGPWNPAVAAKQIASIDHYTNGRISVNVVSGWFKAEFTSIGQWWLEHAERYRYFAIFLISGKPLTPVDAAESSSNVSAESGQQTSSPTKAISTSSTTTHSHPSLSIFPTDHIL